MADGEPDSGVGDNLDLGRLFSLLVRGQANTARVMGEMRDSMQRSLHMAQSFMTGAGSSAAHSFRVGMGGTNPLAGQTTASTPPGPVYNITSLPPNPGGGPQPSPQPSPGPTPGPGEG